VRHSPTGNGLLSWMRKDRTAQVATVLMLGLGAFATIFEVSSDKHDLEAQKTQAVTAVVTEKNVVAQRGLSLAEQVQAACLASGPSSEELQRQGACGAADRVVASPGIGPRGAPGQPGLPGESGSQGPVGPSGPAGKDGAVGPSGPPGADGADGKSGKDGKDGKNGTDGQPPSGWVVSNADGSTITCVRAKDFSPATPRYTCTGSSAPESPGIPGG
jgi:Collagen triple helix repeat (20 copies)